jgi:hypothetical protein
VLVLDLEHVRANGRLALAVADHRDQRLEQTLDLLGALLGQVPCFIFSS